MFHHYSRRVMSKVVTDYPGRACANPILPVSGATLIDPCLYMGSHPAPLLTTPGLALD